MADKKSKPSMDHSQVPRNVTTARQHIERVLADEDRATPTTDIPGVTNFGTKEKGPLLKQYEAVRGRQYEDIPGFKGRRDKELDKIVQEKYYRPELKKKGK